LCEPTFRRNVSPPTSAAATCSRWFLARGFFYPEDGGDTFLRNVDSYTKVYGATSQKTAFFMVTAVKTSNLTRQLLLIKRSEIMHIEVIKWYEPNIVRALFKIRKKKKKVLSN
jgi:hypothetical protein